MTSRYILVVSLWVYPGQEEAFEAFERDAAQLMAKHGGRIDSAIRIEPDLTPPADGPPPHEVHIVSFPNLAAAGALRAGPGSGGAEGAPRRDHLADGAARRVYRRTLLIRARSALASRQFLRQLGRSLALPRPRNPAHVRPFALPRPSPSGLVFRAFPQSRIKNLSPSGSRSQTRA